MFTLFVFVLRFTIGISFHDLMLGLPETTVIVKFKQFHCRHFARVSAGFNTVSMIESEIKNELQTRSAINVFHESHNSAQNIFLGNKQVSFEFMCENAFHC